MEHRGVVLAFWIALPQATAVMRTRVAMRCQIWSDEMAPVLLPEERVVIDRRAYRDRLPARGEIVWFLPPDDPTVAAVDRVIGLPGEQITIQGRDVWIGDRKLERSPEGPYVLPTSEGPRTLAAEREQTPEGISYTVLQSPSREDESALDPESWTVPADCLFVLSDNRDNPWDSLVWDNPFICRGDLLGRVVSRVDSRDPETGKRRRERLGAL